MPEPFRSMRDLGGARILHENHSPRWHAPGSLERREIPSWREIPRPGQGAATETAIEESGADDTGTGDLAFGEQDVARMCAAAALRARNEALHGEEDKMQARLATLAGDIARIAATSERAREEFTETARLQLARLLATTINAIFPDPSRRTHTDEILRFVRQCVARLEHPDQLQVETAPELADAARDGIGRIISELGVNTRIRVVGSKGLQPGQVRVAWNDGWAENDPDLIERVVRENLAILVGEPVAAEAARLRDDATADQRPVADPAGSPTGHPDETEPAAHAEGAPLAQAEEEEP
ncbi:MAG: hypothetical protein KDF64_00475 [Geminicoccaceae bacterium]|nr:hypothetical protein [Geminicoccaceae bacterium]